MQTRSVRNAVVGAGAVGSAAAYHLALRGEPVLLVEQFTTGHDRGSSHGESRIIRHSYADDRYARLMPRAFQSWRDLEADAATPLYVRTGGVSFCPPGNDYVGRVTASLQAVGVPHRRLDGRALHDAIPAFAVPADYDVVFEPDAGLLYASRALALQVDLVRRSPGTEILENTPVRGLDLGGDRPTMILDDVAICAERLIIAAGPWVSTLLPELMESLRPTRQQVLYLQPSRPLPFSIGAFPVFICMGPNPDDAFYGLPGFLSGGLKVARHGGPETDVNRLDRGVEPESIEEIRQFLRGHVPSLAEAPILRSEICLYTMAAEENFLVGPYRGRPDVLLASPCSGHGFKFSNLVGRALADLACDGSTDPDLAFWTPPTGRSGS
ncbi:MAG TPA: N-methyl-L-tryptophan oxidase [Isosphaeraceae bacterium]|nr:N-methyl-L-tryptophan oxidase [Isosphaeraceae bacterium]